MAMRGVTTKGRGKWKRVVAFFFLLLVFAVLLNSVRKIYEKKKDAERALAQMNEEVAELKEREKELKETLARMETNEGIGFELRKKLNVAASGESVAILVEEEAAPAGQDSDPSLWQKIKDFFSGMFE